MQPVRRRRSINASDVLAGSASRASSTREASTEGNAGVTLPSSQAGGVSETGGGRVWGHLQEGTATTQRVTGGSTQCANTSHARALPSAPSWALRGLKVAGGETQPPPRLGSPRISNTLGASPTASALTLRHSPMTSAQVSPICR